MSVTPTPPPAPLVPPPAPAPAPAHATATTTTAVSSNNVLAQLFSNGYLISVIVIVGLIVLMALGKLSIPEGLPPLLALAGVHLGASVSTP